MLSQSLNISDKVPGGVLFETCMGSALSRTPLIEKHDPIDFRIEVATIVRRNPAARSAVQKNRRLALGVATLFVVKLVDG
jgi:hypothetical protein